MFAKNHGGGKQKLYIQEAKNGTYILRTYEGVILKGMEFSEGDLRKTPWN